MRWLKASGIVFGFCLLIGLASEASKWYQSHCPQNIQVAIGVITILIAIILLGKAIDENDKKDFIKKCDKWHRAKNPKSKYPLQKVKTYEKQGIKKTSSKKSNKKAVKSH